MLRDLSLSEFMSELSSGSPAPGGGSASALNGAMAAGLAAMVCRISARRKELEFRLADYNQLAGVLDQLRSELISLLDEDAEAFNKVMAAFKLPKATDEEKKIRSAEIQKAYAVAVEVPLRTAACCVKAAESAAALAECFNRNAESDLATSICCARAGMQGAFCNVRINLPSIKDPAYAERIQAELKRLEAAMDASAAKVQALLAEKA